MDYPQLNLLFGLVLVLTVTVNIGLRILLLKVPLSAGRSAVSWMALILHLAAALYIEFLFLQRMTPSFNRQIVVGLLLIGAMVALVTAWLYRKAISLRTASFLFWTQMLVSLVGVIIAAGLHGSLVPAWAISAGW